LEQVDAALIKLEVFLPEHGVPPRAKEWLDAVAADAPKALAPLFEPMRTKPLALAQQARDEAAARYAQATAELQARRDHVRDIAGRADVSPKDIADAVSKLEEEKQTLELNLMGKKARRDAMQTQIAKQSAAIEKKVQQDPIATELQKAVEAREQKVDFVRRQMGQGVASASDVTDAVAAAAEAKAKLLQRRRDAAAEAGGDALEAFNRDLLTLSVDIQEIQAKLDFVQDRLKHLRGASDQTDALQRALDQAKAAEDELDSKAAELRKVQHELAAAPTAGMTVIAGEDRATFRSPLFGGGGAPATTQQ
jgi:chromosome segregation ATPase